MKGWKDIGSDVSWDEYGGKWAKRARDGSYYVLDFTNMYDACGERDCKRDGQAQYVCEVKRVDLSELDAKTLKSARDCVCLDLESVDEKHRELAQVEACVSYGCAQPLESFSGDVRPSWIRAEARRYAEELMRDAQALEERLERPVNAIGSTAREYGRGDIDSALSRGPFDPAKNLMRKLHGMPPESEVTFGTLEPSGELVNVRRIKHSDLRRCPFAILVPEHYRDDGSCKCDDADHRKMMIAEWEYSEESFANIPLRSV